MYKLQDFEKERILIKKRRMKKINWLENKVAKQCDKIQKKQNKLNEKKAKLDERNTVRGLRKHLIKELESKDEYDWDTYAYSKNRF